MRHVLKNQFQFFNCSIEIENLVAMRRIKIKIQIIVFVELHVTKTDLFHCKLQGNDQTLKYILFRIDCAILFDSHEALVPSNDQLLRFHSAETVIGHQRTIL